MNRLEIKMIAIDNSKSYSGNRPSIAVWLKIYMKLREMNIDHYHANYIDRIDNISILSKQQLQYDFRYESITK